MQTFKTSLIMPCYFANESLLKMTYDSLSSLRYGTPDQVIVVDDGSPISFDWTGGGNEIHYQLPKNLGYAGAVNHGLKEATGEVLIIANNDITFTPGWLEAILIPIYRGADISSIVTSDNGYTTEDKITWGDKFGSLWAMKREVYDKIGGLDERFGNYAEDLDYRRRAINAGFKIAKNHNHLVEHEAKATFKIVDPTDSQYVKALERYRDKWGFIE